MALLIDSSLWVDFTRRKSPPALKSLIHPWIIDPAAALCEPVAFEVLRHANPDERPPLTAQFATLPLLATPPELWRQATRLGQDCRDGGFTAGSLDLLIAALAIHHQAELVTFDSDHVEIARHTPLKVRLLSRDPS
mgnify:CR=1 FL=1